MAQGTGSAGTAIAVSVGVVWGIFMPLWAVGLLGTYSAKTRNLVGSFVPNHREPLFLHAGHSTREDAL